jgi:hypothetical protein
MQTERKRERERERERESEREREREKERAVVNKIVIMWYFVGALGQGQCTYNTGMG